jgi:hypothetical protein
MVHLPIGLTRDALVLALILVTVGGSVYVVVGSVNYYQFYPALTKLRLNFANLQWNSTQSTSGGVTSYSLNGTANFALDNPSSYHGLVMRVFQPDFSVLLNDTDTIQQGPIASAAGFLRSDHGSLEPGNVLAITIPFQGAGSIPDQVAQTMKNGGKAAFIFDITVDLNTFLDNVAQVRVYFECSSSKGPGACNQTGVLIVPGHSPFGPMGGGGGA